MAAAALFPFPMPVDAFDLYLLLGRKQGGFLQITAHEFGIFKRMCRSKTSIQTKDYFQLKHKGVCLAPNVITDLSVFPALSASRWDPSVPHTPMDTQVKPSSITRLHSPQGLDWGQKQ